ncbi:hypothetical protein [Providencia sp. Me31A]|uniref:hypothetical protein n=1 Tax=Providencia sp. Me31A TaxID=3392637 RepID=UPI003D26E572
MEIYSGKGTLFMGLDAFVPCNCFIEGKTTEPPVPREWIMKDDEGYFCLNPEYSNDDSLKDKIHLWSEHCCKHSGMKIRQSICNWAGVRAFQQAIRQIDPTLFPILSTQLPNANGGCIHIEDIKKALSELDLFENYVNSIRSVYLINTDNQQVMYEYIDAYRGRIITSQRYSLAFNKDGLNIFELETERVRFKGKRIEQQVYFYPQWIYRSLYALNNKVSSIKKVRWINRDTGEAFETPWGLSIDGETYPTGFSVEERAVSPSEYQYITQPLRNIFIVAIEMNNAVFWC